MNRVFFLLLVWITAVCFAGKWTAWQDATLCTGTSCKDWERDGRFIPYHHIGQKIQVRYCKYADEIDTTPCANDKDGGEIRTINCKAEPNEVCAGWSEWQNYGYCECEPYTQTGIIMQKRRCNNPAPVYGDRMRTTPSGEDAMEESTVELCDCPNIVTTTTTEKPERLWMCCCEKERLDGSSQPEPVTKGTVFGRGRRQAKDSPDYFLDCITDKKDPNCCKSLEESTAAEKPEESQQKIYDNY